MKSILFIVILAFIWTAAQSNKTAARDEPKIDQKAAEKVKTKTGEMNKMKAGKMKETKAEEKKETKVEEKVEKQDEAGEEGTPQEHIEGGEAVWISSGSDQAVYRSAVSTQVTKYMAPFIVAQKGRAFESHSSPIEQVTFVSTTTNPTGNKKGTVEAAKGAPQATFGKGKQKHPYVTFEVHISKETCRGFKLCFGRRSNLDKHLKIVEKAEMGSKSYIRSIALGMFDMMEKNEYEVDACEGMTILEYKMPSKWITRNKTYSRGVIFFSDVNQGKKIAKYRAKTAAISNVEQVVLRNNANGAMGIEIKHGPRGTTNSATTFYEESDLWSGPEHIHVVLAQDHHQCAARIQAPLTTHTFVTRDVVFNFRPSTIYRMRKGTNVWAIPIGFILGATLGFIFGSLVLCKKSGQIYKHWNDEMKKVYGKFATAGVSQMTTVEGMSTVGGVSAVSTVGGGESAMTGVSAMSTIGGAGGQPGGGASMMGGESAIGGPSQVLQA